LELNSAAFKLHLANLSISPHTERMRTYPSALVVLARSSSMPIVTAVTLRERVTATQKAPALVTAVTAMTATQKAPALVTAVTATQKASSPVTAMTAMTATRKASSPVTAVTAMTLTR
jgi:hypothetical protein